MLNARHANHGASRPGNFGFPVASFSSIAVDASVSAPLGMNWAKLQAAVLAALVAFHFGGTGLSGATSTTAACVAILLFGLPHGTLDLEIIKREQRAGGLGMSALLIVYLGLATAMFLLWRSAPVAALATFLVVAVIHFSEDWRDLQSTFLAQGMAIALLTAPTLLHLTELEQVFVAVAGHEDAVLIANLMLLLAPMSMAVAIVSLLTLWRAGLPDQAVLGGLILIGMVVLPPVVGFALFFCLYHSPRHLGMALTRVAHAPIARRVVPLLTLAALGLAAALFAGEARADLSAQFVAASFMTLSMLTVPHMLVPAIVAAMPAKMSKGMDHANQGPAGVSAQRYRPDHGGGRNGGDRGHCDEREKLRRGGDRIH